MSSHQGIKTKNKEGDDLVFFFSQTFDVTLSKGAETLQYFANRI